MKTFKKIFKGLGIALCVVIAVVLALAVYNQITLKIEANKIFPNGEMIDLGDYSVHVYSEGENNSEPTLVFLSGSATVAPVYDFKPLYNMLSDSYKIAVVEKAGYGYSDHADVPRDIDTMVEELRNALIGANIPAPYILLPHSMSGLEAMYWQQQYPDEIAAIIGLDMATPYAYENFDFSKVNQMIYIGSTAAKLGLIRIPGVYPLNTDSLTTEEIAQQKMLAYKNAVNFLFVREGETVYDNSLIVANGNRIDCPVLLFSSNGDEIGDFWIDSQERFAQDTDAELIGFDCGHYLHYTESEALSKKIKEFIFNFG